jgi:hypothetical protein
LIAPGGSNGTVNFNFTAITTEDGTSATNSDVFTVQLSSGPGESPVSPLAPKITIGQNVELEDQKLNLDIDLTRDSSEVVPEANVTYSIVIYNLPEGFSLSGDVFYNVVTETWVASKEALDNGKVFVNAPGDFAGELVLGVQGIATSTSFLKNATEILNATLSWTPDGDGPSITASAQSEDINSTSLKEDRNFTLSVNLTAIDADGSETVGEWVIIEFGAGFVTGWSYEFSGVVYSFGPFAIDDRSVANGITFNGQAIANGINISVSDLDNLKIVPNINWHGDISITIHGFTTEELDSKVVGWSHDEFNFKVEAVADVADLVTQTITAVEFTRTSIKDMLSASLIDMVEANGAEIIAVKLVNIPEGSQFFLRESTERYGGFVSPDVYSIPNAKELPNLEFVGPQYVSGSFTVTLSALTFETSNFDEFITTESFTLVIKPVASPFLLLSEDIEIDRSGSGPLVLNVRMEDTEGFTDGEDPPEIIELFFTLPSDDIYLQPLLGGSLEKTGVGSWTFQGSEEQANAINVVNTNYTGEILVGVMGQTVDANRTKSGTGTDDFDFKITFKDPSPSGAVINDTVSAIINGTLGNDIIMTRPLTQVVFAGDGDDLIFIESGDKTITGGIGADQFVLKSTSNRVTITDFNASQGDQLNVGALINFDVYDDVPSNFVRMEGSTLEVFNGITWVEVATLTGVTTSFNANTLYTSGNLLL